MISLDTLFNTVIDHDKNNRNENRRVLCLCVRACKFYVSKILKGKISIDNS